ncbi:MAG: hypothetical protein KJ957_03475 [Candidatus Omnitrophica bacterium]|nr:hypothetical protein [Candidatus Omnitrophota bacterium]MBU1853088.1 hypothetical protein [Candidatus Omnitrophota bacterium]
MSKIYSAKIKNKACLLRSKGFSLKEISLELDIPKNTIQGWVRYIELTNKQRRRLSKKEKLGGYIGRLKAKDVLKRKIEDWKRQIRKRVNYMRKLPYKDEEIGKLTCGLLYLCEGGKYPSTRQLTFGNSDPKIIRSFLKLLRQWFHVDESKFRCRVMHRWDQDGKSLNRYWSNLTKISPGQFYKSYADKRTLDKPTKKEGYKGVCAVMYFNTNLQFELQAIGESIVEFGGADGN